MLWKTHVDGENKTWGFGLKRLVNYIFDKGLVFKKTKLFSNIIKGNINSQKKKKLRGYIKRDAQMENKHILLS